MRRLAHAMREVTPLNGGCCKNSRREEGQAAGAPESAAATESQSIHSDAFRRSSEAPLAALSRRSFRKCAA